MTLKEVLEAAEAVQAKALTDDTLRYLAQTAIVLAGRDPGVGDESQKRVLQGALRGDVRPKGLDYLTVQKICDTIERGYLAHWADALKNPPTLGPERIARSLAAHLLDSALSREFLYRWWRHRFKKEAGTRSLSELVTEADALLRNPSRGFEVLVAFSEAPQGRSGMPPNWLSASMVSDWLRTNGFSVQGVRQVGGLWVPVQAKDVWGALEETREIVGRLISRVALGTEGRLRPLARAWVKGESKDFGLRPRRRRVEVHALHREDKLYASGEATIVDAGLELSLPLDSGAPSSAVAGGWAAIEALLSGPGDRERVLAGDRMASLVACSYPRSELTTLSYKLQDQGGPRARDLKRCTSNRDRAELVAKTILAGEKISFADSSDAAALSRLRLLLQDPHKALHDVERHLTSAFRRLYRCRNIVLHWGKTDAVGLRACLRTTAPLVGAGLDRIAHASFVEGTHPLELAARARITLETVGTQGGCSVVDLLA